jgi:hypothetical protein
MFDATGGGIGGVRDERNKQLAASLWAASPLTAAPTGCPCSTIAMQPDVIFFLTDDDDPMRKRSGRGKSAQPTIERGHAHPIRQRAPTSATIFSSNRETGGQYATSTGKLSRNAAITTARTLVPVNRSSANGSFRTGRPGCHRPGNCHELVVGRSSQNSKPQPVGHHRGGWRNDERLGDRRLCS